MSEQNRESSYSLHIRTPRLWFMAKD